MSKKATARRTTAGSGSGGGTKKVIEYNGLRLEVLNHQCWHHKCWHHSGIDGRTNWSVSLKFPDNNDEGEIRRCLTENGHILRGLQVDKKEVLLRVISQCDLRVVSMFKMARWDFWTEPPTQVQLDRETFREIAGRT